MEKLQIIQNKIHTIRNEKIMLDYDLAALYEVLTKNLNLAVKRNINRFPEDFMFQLTKEEYNNLRLKMKPQVMVEQDIYLMLLQNKVLPC